MQSTEVIYPRGRPTRFGLAGGLVLLVVALVLAGCGGSSGVASLGKSHSRSGGGSSSSGGGAGSSGAGPSSSGSGPGFRMILSGLSRASELEFSDCMRQTGVANFPDPSVQGVFQGSGLDPQSLQFQAALTKCQKDLPQSSTPAVTGLSMDLKYAHCMRSHGVPNFPDPTTGGGTEGFQIPYGSLGPDPDSGIVQRANVSCSRLVGEPAEPLIPPAG
jgi:hypothetical protein